MLAEHSSSSRWYKVDLQIASPLGGFKVPSADLLTPEGRAKAAADFVAIIEDAGIEVFAVTDHNSTEMLVEVRDAARAAGLVMFPGMELSTGTGSDGVHLLLLGDPDADITSLTFEWHKAAGFSRDYPAFDDGVHRPSRRSLIDILDDLPEDTIAIAPHILTENGVASGDSIKESSIKWRCLHHDRLEAVDVGTPNGEGGFNSKFRARELDHFPAVQRMAYVATSDAYEPDKLVRHTWIRMHRPNLASLRQALLDHEARIFCHWDPRLAGDPNEVKHAHVKSIRLDGLTTSKEALEVEFDPRITVVIGSRGSGKSTIVQGLRAVFGMETDLPEQVRRESERYQSDVFRDASISSVFVEAISGAEDTATWRHQSGVSTTHGNSLVNARVVSQKELFERTTGDRPGEQSPSANMLTLVDEALDDDQVSAELLAAGIDVTAVRIDQFSDELQERRRLFAETAARRLEADTKVAGRKKVEEDLAEVKRKLAALDDEKEKEKLASAQETLADKSAVDRYASKAHDLASILSEITLPEVPALVTKTGRQFFEPLRELSEQVSSTIDTLVTDIRRVTADSRTQFATEENVFAKAVASANEVKIAYESKLAELGVDLSQYEVLDHQKMAFTEELRQIDGLDKTRPKKMKDEAEAWTELNALFANRRSARETFTGIVSSRTPGLRFSVIAFADHSAWRRSIHTELGFRQGDHTDALLSIAEWVWSTEHSAETRLARSEAWRDALLSNDYAALSDAKLSPSFVGRLSQASEATRIGLASLRADDAFDMQFLKEGNDPAVDASWQTVTDGSPGQRSAAMLAFTLSYGDSPLVLDQPEDDLDSALVSELIVNQFRDARWKRQIIVVTHEANIPVNTDAEVVVVLENAEGRLRVMSRNDAPAAGPIDDPEVRKSIQELLEGGVRAFVNRERRYDNELSKYRIDVGLLSAKRSRGT
ncbi:TrlF family AAA-like ATPase [Microbacterium maritypicum]|uniref:Phosphoesterase n=1 Tax=Microbacterium maritypicum TaxID=33918 RepID=A0A4Y4B1W2_MICMQ|nr:AAA family ATPase [Microbacterium liquefaciens]GEC74458.1 phosphoesterase [Microbacterium liquefaciens]GGV51095.1 phosphoesterase [Microbacterium liquefaciens]